MSTKRNTVLAVIVCAAAGLMVGTFARGQAPAPVEEGSLYHEADAPTARAINERASAYWKARTRQDLRGAYPFYEASFRATYQPDAFVKTFQRLNRFAPELVAVDDIVVDASGSRAKVRVTVKSKPMVLEGEALISSIDDVWVLADGVWWRQAESMTPVI